MGFSLVDEKKKTLPPLEGKLKYYQGEVTFTTKAPKKPRPTCTAPLDTLAVSIVNVHNLIQWAFEQSDQTLLLALSYITATLPRPSCFQNISHASSGMKSQTYVSRAFSRHDIHIIDSISVEATKEAFEYTPLKIFKIKKKNGMARLVQDGRILNQTVPKPPKMGLPDLDGIIARASSHAHTAQADAQGFFYQIPLSEKIRHFFSFNVANIRGKFQTRVFTRLPMGFSHAPFVAQTLANTICHYAKYITNDSKGDIHFCAWVDNFIVSARSAPALQRGKEALHTAFNHFNIKWSWVNTNEILGMSFAPRGVCLSRSFQEKALHLLRDREQITTHHIMQLMGCVMWANITTIRRPLAADYPLLELLQLAGSATDLDTTHALSSEARRCLSMWRSLIRLNKRFSPPPIPPFTQTLWTDASPQAAAAVKVAQRSAKYAVLGLEDIPLPIFYKELLAVIIGLRMLGDTGPPIVLLSDNLPLVAALAKGHSTKGGPTTNRLVAEILRQVVGVGWVATQQQIADSLTREPRSLPDPRSHATFPLFQSYFLVGGRGHREREGAPLYTTTSCSR